MRHNALCQSFVRPLPHEIGMEMGGDRQMPKGLRTAPFLPVSTTSALVGTEHEEAWTRYFDLNMMDNLNSAYVAFTRAVDELYVLTERPGKATSKNIGWALEKIFSNGYCPPLPASASDSDCMLPSSLVAWNEGHDRLTIGTQPDAGKERDRGIDGFRDLPDRGIWSGQQPGHTSIRGGRRRE